MQVDNIEIRFQTVQRRSDQPLKAEAISQCNHEADNGGGGLCTRLLGSLGQVCPTHA